MNTTHHEFGRRLRDERERRGLTLQSIADSTKIPLSLLAGLERGHLADWPGGLFGRAHFRAYAAAVGISFEPLMVEFLRLLGNDPAPRAACPPTADGAPRLMLAADRRWSLRSIGMRVLASALDLGGIFLISTALARTFKADLSLVCALVGLSYYALATMTLGKSVMLWWLGGRALPSSDTSTANVREGVFFVLRRRLRDSPGRPRRSAAGASSAPAAQTVSR